MSSGASVAKRLVFHIGGYDPITPQAGARKRFAREIGRFQSTWSLKTLIEDPCEDPDQMTWTIRTTAPNWQVRTDYRFVRWDDVIEGFSRRPMYRRLASGIVTFFDFVLGGALFGYLRTNWFYAVFFVYPFLMFGAVILAGYGAGVLAFKGSGSLPVAIVAALLVLGALMVGPWRWLHLNTLFDDWIFSHEYIRSRNPLLEQRLDRLAAEIVAVASNSRADELLVIGHSLGAVLAVDLLDRALKLDPALGSRNTSVALATIGSSLLKIGLHRRATRFRAAAERVSRSSVFWVDYQARVDLMNFYDTQPMAEMGLPAENGPVVRLVEIGRMLDHAMYRRIRLRFYRLHCQFISGNDNRTAYDYFMLVCGPISAQTQALAPDGAVPMIDENGALVGLPESRVSRSTKPAQL